MTLAHHPKDVVTHALRDLRLEFSTDGTHHGISSLEWKDGGLQLAKAPFVLNLYRVLAANELLGEARNRPYSVTTQLRNSGTTSSHPAIRLSWEPWQEHPVRLSATYTLGEPNQIDLSIEIEALAAVRAYELFLSSYFDPVLEPHVIARQQRNAKDAGTPVLHAVKRSPFLYGHYVSFPRDTAAAALMYDGRWQHGKAPVLWATSPTFAVPMAIMARGQTGEGSSAGENPDPVVIQMASSASCFSVNATYASADPDDIVARHNAVYFSLFGSDLHEGEQRKAHLRMVVVPELPPLDALLDLHREFESGPARSPNDA